MNLLQQREKAQEAQSKHYNQHGRNMEPLKTGQKVWVQLTDQGTWKKATVCKTGDSPRSYYEEFEQLFKQFDSSITVQYLKSFKRARVNFSSPSSAAKARIHIHGTPFEDSHIKCYFIQPLKFSSSAYLQLPKPVKQFLISPPASPPVDWEPISESQPVMNYDLISAIAALGPGQTHELHPQSETTPGIVIHVCEQYEPKEEEDEERQGQITDTRSNFSQILSELS
ncbi:hypothetical protein QYM36_010245 [Artemia franciscana]|uniref:Uncharacterized protein n=1 Tax=Artemia franciscana TaxID=6661 RepID=A0AA88HPH5_ARTSF|nr:hypothetical protein QYM36_010245 [Artemia franciscana]